MSARAWAEVSSWPQGHAARGEGRTGRHADRHAAPRLEVRQLLERRVALEREVLRVEVPAGALLVSDYLDLRGERGETRRTG